MLYMNVLLTQAMSNALEKCDVLKAMPCFAHGDHVAFVKIEHRKEFQYLVIQSLRIVITTVCESVKLCL